MVSGLIFVCRISKIVGLLGKTYHEKQGVARHSKHGGPYDGQHEPLGEVSCG